MQDREKNVHNRMVSSESVLQGIKTDKETLENWVIDLSKQLMQEKEKRVKLEEEMVVMKAQLNAILKSIQS
jgi:transposase-like protein